MDTPLSGRRATSPPWPANKGTDGGGQFLGRVLDALADREMEETFYVLEGTIECTREAQTILAAPGTMIQIPPGIAHKIPQPTIPSFSPPTHHAPEAMAGNGPAPKRVDHRRAWLTASRRGPELRRWLMNHPRLTVPRRMPSTTRLPPRRR